MGYIAINNYTKKIKKRTVLDNINLTFDKGKIYGLVGKNGCGKTMLLRGICGFITASQGEIIINNIKITHVTIFIPLANLIICSIIILLERMSSTFGICFKLS